MAYPEPFQKYGVRVIEEAGRGIIADEMGLGKTYQSLLVARRNSGWLPQVVVCPAIVKWNWEREAREKVGLRASVCEGQTPPKIDSGFWSGGESPLFIINYEIIRFWADYFIKLGVRSLVLDECQYLSNPKAKRTKAGRMLARKVDHILALSGTPFTNRPKDFFSILNMIWPAEFPTFWGYAERYCAPRMTPWGWDYSGSANEEELNARLTELGMVRRTRAEVKGEMPAITRSVVPCDLYDEREYEKATADFINYVKGHDPHQLTSAKKGGGLFKVGYLMRLAAKLKLKSVCDWTTNWMDCTDSKIVLFTVHKGAARILNKRIKHPVLTITGDTPHKQRRFILDQFERDSDVRGLVASLAACGTGLDGLQKAASDLAFVELGHTPAIHRQAESRLDRMGQSLPVTANYLVARNTIEERACKLIQRKQDVASLLLDGKKGVTELSIHQELNRTLQEENHGNSIFAYGGDSYHKSA